MNDEQVKQAAPEQLTLASEAIDHAKALMEKGASREEVDHYAYLAKQRIAIAEEEGQGAGYQSEINKGNLQRDQMMLEAKQAKIELLKKEMHQLKAKETKRGLVLTLGSVLFDLGKSSIKSGGMRGIQKLGEFLQSDPSRNVMVEGYTDSTGPLEYNQALSLHRANAVRDALVADGINPQRIVTKGYGPKYPVATNRTPQGRQENRRVEIVLSDEHGTFPESR